MAVLPGNIDVVPELIMQDGHVIYNEIEASLRISSTIIHSRLHEHLEVKTICSLWIPHNLTNIEKRFVSIGANKYWKNTIVVPQKTFIRSTQVTNHGSVRVGCCTRAKSNETCLWKNHFDFILHI